MEPITYGVIMGLGESFLAGKQLEKEASRAKAEKEAETLQSSLDTFVTFGTNKENRRVVSSLIKSADTGFFNLLGGLPQHSQAAILMNGMGDLSLTAVEQEYLTGINGANGIELARGLVVDRNVQSSLMNSSTGPAVWSLITSKAASGLSAGERDIFNSLPEDPQKRFAEAQQLMVNYPEGSVFGSILAQIKEPSPVKEYVPLDTDFFNSIRGMLPSKSGDDGDQEPISDNTLAALQSARTRILPFVEPPLIYTAENPEGIPDPKFVPDQKAFKDLFAIDVLLGEYGTVNGLPADADATTISERLQIVRDGLPSTSLPDQSARKGYAELHLLEFMGDEKFEDALNLAIQNGPGTPGALSFEDMDNFNAITAMAEQANDVDNNRNVYLLSDGASLAVDTGKSIQDDPAAFLFNLDGQIKPGQFKNMDADTRQRFISDLTSALTKDADIRRGLKNQAGESTPAPARNYRNVLANIEKAIPIEFGTILTKMGFAKPNETANGMGNVPADQISANGTPLPETQLKLDNDRVINIDDAAVQFANSMGMTTHEMFKSDLHYGLLDFGSNNPARLYKAVNSVNNSSIFENKVDKAITQDSAIKLAQIFAAQGITDVQDQINVVSAVMSGDIPSKYQASDFEYAMSEQNFNAFMMQATGGQYKTEDISKLKTNSTDFLTQATEVRGYLENLGEGSRFTDSLSSFVLNIGGVKGNLVSQAFQGGRNLLQELGIFKESDVRAADGYTASQQAKMVQETADEFFANELLSNNALLKQALVTLAYNYAKTMDPSGRISERDFAAALEAVSAGDLDVRATQIQVVENLINKTRDNLAFFDGVFAVGVEASAGGQMYLPTTATIKRARSMRYFRQIQQNTMGIEKVTMYTQDVANFGTSDRFPSAEIKKKYAFTPASNLGSTAVLNGITRVMLKKRDGTAGDFIPGVPLYVDRNGVILTQARLASFTGGI